MSGPSEVFRHKRYKQTAAALHYCDKNLALSREHFDYKRLYKAKFEKYYQPDVRSAKTNVWCHFRVGVEASSTTGASRPSKLIKQYARKYFEPNCLSRESLF